MLNYEAAGVFMSNMQSSASDSGVSSEQENVIIFVPGFLEHSSHHLFFNGARYFLKKDIDVFHFEPSYISLMQNCKTLTKNINSLNYKNKYIVAHSLGAIIALLAELKQIAGLVLWDPSLHPSEMFKNYKYNTRLHKYEISEKDGVFLERKFVVEASGVPQIEVLLKKVKVPVKIIVAEKGGAFIGKNIYHKNVSNKKSLSLIKKANHNFDEVGAESKLFSLTYKWIKNDS